MKTPRRALIVPIVAALIGAPVVTAAVVVGLAALEWAGDTLARIGVFADRPTAVRLVLAAVVVAFAVAARWWWTTSTVGDRLADAVRRLAPPDASEKSAALRDDTDVPEAARRASGVWLSALAAALGAVAIVHWPNLGRLSTHIIGIGDSDQHVGLANLLREEMSFTNPLPGRLSGIVHPEGLDARLLDGYGPVWMAAVLGFLVGPVLAYNLALIGATVANSLSGWLLASRFTQHRPLLFVAALGLGSAPNVAVRAHAGHMNLTWVFTVALLAWYAIGCRTRPPSPWKLGLLLALAYLGSGYFLVIGGVIVVVTLLVARPADPKTTLVRLGAGVVLGAVLLAPWAVSRVQFAVDSADGPQAALVDDAIRSAKRIFVADSTSLVAAVPNERFGTVPLSDVRRDRLAATVEGWANPGWVLLAALGAGVVVGGRTRLLIGAGSLLLFVLALGPVPRRLGDQQLVGPTDMGWLPYTAVDAIPIVDSLRVPGRFAMGLAVLAVVGLASSGEWIRRRVAARTFLVGCVVLVGVIALTNPRRVHAFESVVAPNDAGALADLDGLAGDGEAAVVLPNDCRGFEVRYTVLAIHTDVPLVGCHAPHLTLPLASGMPSYRTDSMRSLRCFPELFAFDVSGPGRPPTPEPAALAEGLAADLGVRFVVVHSAEVAAEPCAPVRGLVDEMVASGVASVVGTPGHFVVLDLAP